MATPSLAMIPSAYADSKVYSVLPNNGDGDFTFNRDSSATRIGQNGLIQEVGFFGSNKVSTIINDTSNLFPTFTDNGGGSYTCATTSTAYAGFEQPVSDDFTISVGQVYRISFDYTLNSGANDLQVFIGNGGVGSSYSGSPVLVSGTGTFTKDFTITTAATDAVFASQINAVSNFTISNISVKLIQGDQPRLNYDISNGVVQSCPSLLLEPASTNLITYSTPINSTPYTYGGGGVGVAPTYTANAGISPDGTSTAVKLFFDINGGTTSSDLSQFAYTGSALTGDYTSSFYLKSSDSNSYTVTLLNTNGVTSETVITPEWQRFTFYNGGGTTSTNLIRIRLRGNENTSNTASLLAWGFQLENQAYATSLIPTNGSSQTRAAETCFGAGTSSTFNSTEGVLYAEISGLANDGTNRRITISDGAGNNDVGFRFNNVSNQIQVVSYVNSNVVVNQTYVLPDITVIKKYALKWALNNYALWVDGVEVITNNSAISFPQGTLNTLNFGSGTNTSNFYGNTKDIRVYNEALTDAQLQTLTTL